MKRPLKAVQIGAGPFSRANHAPALRRLSGGPAPRVSLEAICDLDAARAQAFCRDFGYKRAFIDIDEMIDETQPDVIYTMVQPTATFHVVKRVLPVGLPIFTEKPPGVSVAQAEGLATLAQDHGIISYVAFNRRRAPGLTRLKRWGEERGPVRYLRAEMLRNNRLEPEFAIGTAIHPLDCLRYLCGDVLDVETTLRPHPGTEARDLLVRLTFASGAIADLAVLVDCGLQRERYLMHVQSLMMEATLGAGYTGDYCPSGEVAYARGQVLFDDPGEQDPLLAGGFLGEHTAFLDAVDAGQLPDCCLQDAKESLKLAAAVDEGYSGPLSQFASSHAEPCAG